MKTESIQWLLDHAASAYEAEIESTDKLRQRVGLVVTLTITPCIGAVIYLASSLRGEVLSDLNLFLFWAPLLVSSGLILFSSGWVSYVLLKKFYYSRVPSPSEIVGYFETHPDQDTVLEEARLALLKEYAKSVDHNFEQNEHRKVKLLLAQRFAFCSAFFLVLCIPRWAYNFTHNEPKAQSVRVVSPIEILKEKEMKNTSETNTQSQQQTTTPTPTQPAQTQTTSAKPSFPQSKMVFDSARSDAPTRPSFPRSRLVTESADPKADSGKK